MRVPLKITMMAALLVVASASGSWAISLPGGHLIEMKFVNFDIGTVYNTTNNTWVGSGALNALNQTFYDHTGAPRAPWATGEDGWGIFALTDILDYGLATAPGGVKSIWNWQSATTEITGIFWGLTDTYLSQTGTVGNPTFKQEIHGTGLEFAFFEDTNKNFTKNGPLYEMQYKGPGGLGPDERTSSAPVWGTVTDGTCIWSGYSVPGYATTSDWQGDTTHPNDEFYASYTPYATGFNPMISNGGFNAVTGPTSAYTGLYNEMFAELFEGVELQFSWNGHRADGGWGVQSDDPVTAVVTPELSTSWLMLLGMVPVGMAWRRRKRS